MMGFKGKNKNVLMFAAGMVLLLVLGLFGYCFVSGVGADPAVDSGSDRTQLTPVQNNPLPSSSPIVTVAPQPTSTWINLSPPPQTTPVGVPTVSADVWQTLYVTNKDGSSYWVNPPKAFNPLALFGAPDKDASQFKQVSTLQNNIYLKVDSSKQVTSWMFSAKETIGIYNSNGFEVGTIAKDATVNGNGGSLVNGANTWVLGASISADQLEPLVEKITRTQCYFVIKLSNIQLALTFSDGSTELLTADYGNADNTLAWLIYTT